MADDSAAVRWSLSTALSFVGCDVATAASAEEALALLHAGLCPCVVLLDLLMLHGRAEEFRSARRAEPRLAEIPVVVLTCADEVASVRERLEARAWVVKPPDLAELHGLIARLCARTGETPARGESPGPPPPRGASIRAPRT